LVKGLEVTGFDNEEEAISYEKIKAYYLPFYLDSLKKEGALSGTASFLWSPFRGASSLANTFSGS